MKLQHVIEKNLGRLLLVIVGLLVVTVGYLSIHLRRASLQNTVNSTVGQARTTIQQYSTLRKYYTENVTRKAKKAGLKVTFDHKGREGAIPLPATLIHDLSDLMAQDANASQLRLYSADPFPNRRGRALDEFGQQAIAFLGEHPTETFVRTDLTPGRESVRVAIADRLTLQACVDCHNSHPDSPRRDWKLGDVRGVLEVTSPITGEMAASNQLLSRMA